MKSVAVLGDVRVHLVWAQQAMAASEPEGPLGERSNSSAKMLFGGAAMMADAVTAFLHGRGDGDPAFDIPILRMSSEEIKRRMPSAAISTHWNLETKSASGTMRLVDPKLDPAGRPLDPPWPREWIRDPAYRGPIGTLKDDDIDIYVVDDLGLFTRDVWIGPASANSHRQRPSQASYAAALLRTLKSFLRRAQAELAKPLASPRALAPLMMLSISAPLPASTFGTTPDAKPNGLWNFLLRYDALLPRVVVMIDADQLAKEGLKISRGLSWERTAQDTVVELQTNPRLRHLMRFNHVIVRYGAAGVLYSARNAKKTSFTLFFDPQRDSAPTDEELGRGHVLGESSVFTATLVENICLKCNDFDQEPPIDVLEDAVFSSIAEALYRCQSLTELGYGESVPEFFNRELPDIFKACIPESPNFAGPSRRTRRIQHVEVPHAAPPNWSIMAQSTRFRVGEIASQIVRYGINQSFSQPDWNQAKLEEVLHDAISDSAGRDASDKSISSPAVIESAVSDPKIAEIFNGRPLSLSTEFVRKVLTTFDQRHSVWSLLSAAKIRKYRPSSIRQLSRKQARESIHEIVTAVLDDHGRMFDPVPAPIARFGGAKGDAQMTVVDSREIEGFRSIQRMISMHLKDVQKSYQQPSKPVERPLCLAIFGPPGSGKTFAVRRIVDGLKNSIGVEAVFKTFNLAQFSQTPQLEPAFQEISTAISERKCPIAFFDEFDSVLGEEQLGWLKYFLAPMEDGTYRNVNVRDAVLVFAGGTSTTFSEFSRESRSSADQEWLRFSQAKGPDFVSRLRGHIDITGINPTSPGDETYLIRRGILLRELLCKIQSLDVDDVARIDDGLLNALLFVPKYKHGGRSMRTILDLCRRGSTVRVSALPTTEQLNMHVDGKSFMDIVNERGARRWS